MACGDRQPVTGYRQVDKETTIITIMNEHILTDIPNKKKLLTSREKEIIALLATGLLDKEMADCLGLSINTVKNHLKNIYHKLEFDNRLEAVIWYYNRRPATGNRQPEENIVLNGR